MEQQTPPPSDEEPKESNSLDQGSSLEGGEEIVDATPGGAKSQAPAPTGFKAKLKKFDIYIVLIVFIFMIAGAILAIAYFQNKQASTTSTLKTQTLTQSTLDQVANSDATVGSTQQVLNVLSSAVFAGKVLVRQDLEVAGGLQIGGTVGITNLSVAGSTQLGQTQVSKDLSVGGSIAVQGSSSIGKDLQVKGSGTFAGPVSAPQITTTSLQLNSDLTLTHHIIIGGGTPGRTQGPAVGSGGSTSVSGSDTAGTISINIGSSPVAGCFATINFTQKYNTTPHVLLTPVGEGGGTIAYYVNRTSTSFSICDSTAAPSGSSFSFDYFVVD